MTTHSLSDLLRSLSEELRALSGTTEEMHHLVCHDHLSQDSDYVRTVQSIDHTTQMLDNLSTFLAVIGEEASEDWQVAVGTALETVRMTELKRRLHGSCAETPDSSNDNGDLELFG